MLDPLPTVADLVRAARNLEELRGTEHEATARALFDDLIAVRAKASRRAAPDHVKAEGWCM